MNDRFNIRYFNKNTKKFEYLKIGAVNFNLFTDWTVYEQGQQCTGLKDKNGKLIYEGDIVKDDHDAWHYVKWVYDSWQLFPCTQNNYTIGIVDDEVEVIGNIYENKELLESEG